MTSAQCANWVGNDEEAYDQPRPGSVRAENKRWCEVSVTEMLQPR